MRLIVTRPAEDANPLIEKLKALGHQALSAPMISVALVEGALVPKRAWQAILVTSANSIRALVQSEQHHALLDVPVLTVGPASASAAEAAGFQNVESANGDLPALTAFAKAKLKVEGGPLLYPSGTRISGDLKAQLAGAGFECIRLSLYDAIAAEQVPDGVADHIRAGNIDGVLLYSPRTARIWAACARTDGVSSDLQNTVHWCLSAAVGRALAETWPRTTPPPVEFPAEPNEISMIEAICAGSGV